MISSRFLTKSKNLFNVTTSDGRAKHVHVLRVYVVYICIYAEEKEE